MESIALSCAIIILLLSKRQWHVKRWGKEVSDRKKPASCPKNWYKWRSAQLVATWHFKFCTRCANFTFMVWHNCPALSSTLQLSVWCLSVSSSDMTPHHDHKNHETDQKRLACPYPSNVVVTSSAPFVRRRLTSVSRLFLSVPLILIPFDNENMQVVLRALLLLCPFQPMLQELLA